MSKNNNIKKVVSTVLVGSIVASNLVPVSAMNIAQIDYEGNPNTLSDDGTISKEAKAEARAYMSVGWDVDPFLAGVDYNILGVEALTDGSSISFVNVLNGSTFCGESVTSGFALVKTDSEGKRLQVKEVVGVNTSYIMRTSSKGNVLLVNTGDGKGRTYNTDFDLVNTYSFGSGSYPYDVSDDLSVYRLEGTSTTTFTVRKYANGSSVTSKSYAYSSSGYRAVQANSIHVLEGGNVVVTATSTDYNWSTQYYGGLFTFNSSLTSIVYEAKIQDYANHSKFILGSTPTADGGLLLYGECRKSGTSSSYPLLLKINSSGNNVTDIYQDTTTLGFISGAVQVAGGYKALILESSTFYLMSMDNSGKVTKRESIATGFSKSIGTVYKREQNVILKDSLKHSVLTNSNYSSISKNSTEYVKKSFITFTPKDLVYNSGYYIVNDRVSYNPLDYVKASLSDGTDISSSITYTIRGAESITDSKKYTIDYSVIDTTDNTIAKLSVDFNNIIPENSAIKFDRKGLVYDKYNNTYQSGVLSDFNPLDYVTAKGLGGENITEDITYELEDGVTLKDRAKIKVTYKVTDETYGRDSVLTVEFDNREIANSIINQGSDIIKDSTPITSDAVITNYNTDVLSVEGSNLKVYDSSFNLKKTVALPIVSNALSVKAYTESNKIYIGTDDKEVIILNGSYVIEDVLKKAIPDNSLLRNSSKVIGVLELRNGDVKIFGNGGYGMYSPGTGTIVTSLYDKLKYTTTTFEDTFYTGDNILLHDSTVGIVLEDNNGVVLSSAKTGLVDSVYCDSNGDIMLVARGATKSIITYNNLLEDKALKNIDLYDMIEFKYAGKLTKVYDSVRISDNHFMVVCEIGAEVRLLEVCNESIIADELVNTGTAKGVLTMLDNGQIVYRDINGTLSVFKAKGGGVVNQAPTITLKGDKTKIEIEQGTDLGTIDFKEYVTVEDEDSDILDRLTVDTSKIKVNDVGDYTIKYTAEDSEGLTTDLEVTVSVVMPKEKAKIEVIKPMVFEVGGKFNPLEYIKATDIDGKDITKLVNADITDVRLKTPGTYDIVYSVKGSNNLTVVEVIQIEVKANKNLPVITAEDKIVGIGENFYPFRGVTAYDEEDGNLTGYIQLKTNDLDTNTPKDYELTYVVTDSDGNTVEKTITITVKDKGNEPVIIAEDVLMEKGQRFEQMEGVSVTDVEDVPFTNPIKVTYNNVDPNVPGIYQVHYEVTDSDGNTVKKIRVVTVKEIDGLPIIIADNLKLYLGEEFTNFLEGVTARDQDGKDISKDIEVLSENVDTKTKGVYKILYSVKDAVGNIGTRMISVKVATAPEIFAEDISIPLVKVKNSKFEPLNYVTAIDEEEGNISDKVKVTKNGVKENEPGVYGVTYEVSNLDGYRTVRTVNVTVENSEDGVTPPKVEDNTTDDSQGGGSGGTIDKPNTGGSGDSNINKPNDGTTNNPNDGSTDNGTTDKPNGGNGTGDGTSDKPNNGNGEDDDTTDKPNNGNGTDGGGNDTSKPNGGSGDEGTTDKPTTEGGNGNGGTTDKPTTDDGNGNSNEEGDKVDGTTKPNNDNSTNDKDTNGEVNSKPTTDNDSSVDIPKTFDATTTNGIVLLFSSIISVFSFRKLRGSRKNK